MSIITTEGLTKRYLVADKAPGLVGTLKHFVNRQTRAIDAVVDVSFSIAPGEVVGFLGPNGAGKTTTLKMLTGLIHPTSGEARVAGHRPAAREPAFLKQITLVMGQKQQLIWDLPALEGLRINAAVYGVAPREAEQRIAALTELLDLGGKLTQPMRKLSLGERMKAELMASLLHQPRVLFLDEPTLGLDINAQAAIREFIRGYNAQTGATVLLTSHYMADITALCARVILIHHGRLCYDGGLDGLITRFTPEREVRVELDEAAPGEVLAGFPEIVQVDGRALRLLVPRERLPQVVARLLDRLPVKDLTVADPPIEDVIAKAFAKAFSAGGVA